MNQITWTLRNPDTKEVFKARQDVSSDHAALYFAVVSERPLLNNHIYETLKVTSPAPLSNAIQPASCASALTNNRLGVARGTQIMTARGEVCVENLRTGDRVITRDRGLQPVKWIGSERAAITDENATILFRKGAIKNARDLTVSANHRIILKGAKALMMYGVKEVLVPAHQLVNGDTILRVVGGEVEFFQIVTAQHEIIYCDAAACESFMPDAQALSALSTKTRRQIAQAVPALCGPSGDYGPAARSFIDADLC